MPNRETIHIPNNLLRREIYNLYKEYVEGVEGGVNFITYQCFMKLWRRQFNKVCIPKKPKMGVCGTCDSLK